mgnify:CR=1 FL=1
MFCNIDLSYGQVKVNSHGLTMMGPLKPQISNSLRTKTSEETSLWVNGRRAKDLGDFASWTTVYYPKVASWGVRLRMNPYASLWSYWLRPRYTFYVQGDGRIWTEKGLLSGSDSTLKCSLSTINGALNIIDQLNGKYYKFKMDTVTKDSFSTSYTGKRMGFISQEVASVLPGAVDTVYNEDSTFTIGVYYSDFIPLLTEGIKEQQSEIESLQTQLSSQNTTINSLQAQLNTLSSQMQLCCQEMAPNEDNETKTGTSFENPNDKNLNFPILRQNVPNPFSESTTIKYFLPQSVKAAILYIHNLEGKEIKQFSLLKSGHGQVVLNAYSINAGMYNYTLVVDGEIVDSKKMILSK